MGKWLRGLGWVGHCSWLGRAGHVKTVLNPCVGHNNEKRCAHLTLHHDEKRRWTHLRGWEERRLVSRLQPHRRPKYIGRRSIYTRFTSPRGNGTRESATFATAARWLPSALLSGPFGRRRGRRRWNRQSRQQRLGRVWLRVDTPPRLRGGISRRRSGVWGGGSAAATGRRRQVVVRRSPGRGEGGGGGYRGRELLQSHRYADASPGGSHRPTGTVGPGRYRQCCCSPGAGAWILLCGDPRGWPALHCVCRRS